MNNIREDNDRITQNYDSISKILKSYELLWIEVSNKAKVLNRIDMPQSIDPEFFHSLKLPEIDAENFENEEARNEFLSHLCNFEQGLKDVIDLTVEFYNDRNAAEASLEEREKEIDQLEEAIHGL